jgi:hypothetical protein
MSLGDRVMANLMGSVGRSVLGTIGGGLILALGHPGLAQTLPLEPGLVALDSPRGALLMHQSRAQTDYLPLLSHFVTQDNQAFCGVASMTMVLNALGIARAPSPQWQMNYFTQDNLLTPETEAIIPRATIAKQGLTLAQLAEILRRYPVAVDVVYGSEISLADFRAQLRQNLSEPGNYILINYLRSTIGQQRGGHISPIGAYNAATDQVLVLDVSRYKYPPVWVKTEALWRAIGTIDNTSAKSRGFLSIHSTQPLKK